MRFTALHPLHHTTYSQEILEPGFVAEFARTAEAVGFDALALTEHPAPSARWRNAGGHDAFDVFAVLGFWAGVTSRIALMPYVLVPGFRSAVLGAKQIATLDRLAGGRLIVPVGTGYLRSEATALGMDFDARNDVLDEALDVWRQVWSGEEVSIHGRFTEADGILARPTPHGDGHPPIWIGGNSARARQRTADVGRGWTPILGGAQLARTTRTAPIPDLETLARTVDDLRRRLEAAGRDPGEVAVQLQGGGGRLVEHDEPAGPYLDWLAEVEAAGVTQLIVELPADSAARSIEGLHRYAAEVIHR
ncbi:MAG: TIGR03619 family F420-dependent LLM class oxidoreductase [Acidimicrobiia bacterium]